MPSQISKQIMPQCLFPTFQKVAMGSWTAGDITAMVDGSICLALGLLRSESGLW